MHLVHGCNTTVGGEIGTSLHGASEEHTEILVQVSQQDAEYCQTVVLLQMQAATYY